MLFIILFNKNNKWQINPKLIYVTMKEEVPQNKFCDGYSEHLIVINS